MLETKGSSRRRAPRRRQIRGTSSIPRTPSVNEAVFTGGWTDTTLTSGTTGAMSQIYSPTIQNSSEYSTFNSLFNEIKVVSFEVIFIPMTPYNTSNSQSQVMVGSNMQYNFNSFTAPTGFADVQNLPHRVSIASTKPSSTIYRMIVPKQLEFSSFAADAPATATPWAGSPGAVVVWGNGFANGTAYWRVNVLARWYMRGRK